MSSDSLPAPTPRSSRLMRHGWLVIALAFFLTVGSSALAWAWRHPDVSFDYGYGMSTTRPVGFTSWTTLADSQGSGSSPVTFTGLEPVFESDGAAVRVEYLICELDPQALEEEGVSSFGFGLSTRAVDRYCLSTRPAQGADFTLHSQDRQELLVGITPTQAGRSIIRAHHVSYRAGWQQGSSDILVETKLKAPQAD